MQLLFNVILFEPFDNKFFFLSVLNNDEQSIFLNMYNNYALAIYWTDWTGLRLPDAAEDFSLS